MGDTRFAAITTTIIVSSYLVAMTVTSLERALAYVGSTGSTSISFILPGLFYYKISAPDSPLNLVTKEDDDNGTSESEGEYDESFLGGGGIRSNRWKKDLMRTLSLALAIYGFTVMIVCLITNIFIVAH